MPPGVISAQTSNQSEGGPLLPRPPHARPCRRGRAAPSRHGPYASENKIHLPRVLRKEDLRPADSRCGAPDSGCAGRFAGALRPMASNRQAAFQIQPGTASPEAGHRNACHMLAPASSIRSASQHHLAHQCQWTRPRPRRSGKYSPGSPYEREAIQIAASVRPEPPRNQRQTRRDRTAGQLSVPPFRSSYCEVHMTSIGHEERHNRTTIVELTRPLLPQTGRSRTPHRPSLVPRAGGGRKPFRLGPV